MSLNRIEEEFERLKKSRTDLFHLRQKLQEIDAELKDTIDFLGDFIKAIVHGKEEDC